MQVLYDISVLGQAKRYNLNGGITRAASELLRALLTHHCECKTVVCAASYGYDAWGGLQDILEFKHLPFKYSLHDKIEHRVSKELNRAYALDATHPAESKMPNARIKKAVFYKLNQRLNRAKSLPSNATSAPHSDVFHSPCFAIPEAMRQYKNLSFFTTVYDLYPLLYPDECVYEQTAFVQSIINAAQPTDWFLTDSQSAKDDLCELGKIDPQRVSVTHLAADKSKFYPCAEQIALQAVRAKYGIPADASYVLSVCTLEPRKNLDFVVRNFIDTLRQQKDVNLYLVLAGGKGWNNAKIFEAIKEADDLKNRIIITGFVANEDLAALYSGAVCFVYPSLYEGFGLPPLEAMQCGTPVITSNTSSLPEVVGDAGIIIDPHDADGFNQALLSLYHNADLRADLSQRGFARAQQFSWEKCARQTVEAYEKAIDAKR